MNPLKIEIKSENTVTEKTQKGNEIRKQQCAIDQGTDYPLPFFITVDQPYPAGVYTLHPQSFRVTPFRSLELNPFNMLLVPFKG